jgi:hypothetical protein
LYCPNPDCPHARETGEAAEYRIGFTECADCGSPLVATRPEPAVELQYEEFVPVLDLLNPALVSFVPTLLESAGIRFFIKGERLQDLFGLGRFGSGFNVLTGPPVLFVEPSRAEEARELLADVEMEGEGNDSSDDEE